MAAMESELFLLKRSFERLDRQYRGAEEKIGEFRDKLRDARLELTHKDRQLEASRKLLSRLGQERTELAVAAEQSRDLSRRLGAKLSLSPEVPEMQAKLQRSKRKVTELTAQLHEAQTRLLLAEEAARQQSAEVVVLKKALGLRMELPELTGYDGQAQLLQSLAKSQEEGANLAAQLADSGRRVNSLEQQVGHLHGELDRLVGVRMAAEEALGAARRDAADANGRAASIQIDLDELQAQMRRTNAHLEEVMAARRAADESADALSAKVRQLKDKQAATERAGKAQVESLRAEIRSVVEASEAAAEQTRHVHAKREATLEIQISGVQKQLIEAEARLTQSARDHDVAVLRLQSRAGALEASLEGSRLREASLERDTAALGEEVDRLARMGQDLSTGLVAARSEAAAHAERAEEHASNTDSERRLRMQVQSQMEASSTRGAVREEQLAAEAGRLRAEAAGLALANERLQADAKLCQEQLSDAAARHASNERHIEELHTTIQSLTKSKTKLQNTMLEQLSLFKSKLQQVEHENLSLRTALAGSSSPSLAGMMSRGSPGGGGSSVSGIVRGSPASGGAGMFSGLGGGGGVGVSYTQASLRSGAGINSYRAGGGPAGSPLMHESSMSESDGRGVGNSSLYDDE